MSADKFSDPITSNAASASASATAVSTAAPAENAERTSTDSAPTNEQADTLIAEGKKAIALKQWEEGVNKFASALEIMGSLVGDQDPAMAPLLLSYGKALFELAFSQAGVMGKEEVEREIQGDDEACPSNLVESADPELLVQSAQDDEEEGEDVPEPSTAEASAENGGEEADEPEDDYNAAWEVLDVARTIYTRIIEDIKAGDKAEELKKGEVKDAELRLADCYQTLGDISCETENFAQAAADYTSSLSLLTPHHPASSRLLASLHFQLGTSLEFLPSRRSDALSHVQSALTSFRERLADLDKPTEQRTNPDLAKMGDKEREAERKEIQELMGDLEVKVEELRQAPEKGGLVEQGIQHLLGGGQGAFGGPAIDAKKEEGPVNDLSSMVRKKKKPAPVAASGSGSGSNGTAAGTAIPSVEGLMEGTKQAAETVKEAVVHAAEKAAEVVEASVVGSGGATAEKREAEGGDESRASKRAKAE